MSDRSDDLPQDQGDDLTGALPGGFDLGGMLEQVQAMQQQMVEAQEAQAAKVITGSAGGGAVTVEVTGGGEFRNVTISPTVVDPTDVEMLEDLVLAAARDAMTQVNEGHESALGGVDLPDLGGLTDGLGGLGGLLGGE